MRVTEAWKDDGMFKCGLWVMNEVVEVKREYEKLKRENENLKHEVEVLKNEDAKRKEAVVYEKNENVFFIFFKKKIYFHTNQQKYLQKKEEKTDISNTVRNIVEKQKQKDRQP